MIFDAGVLKFDVLMSGVLLGIVLSFYWSTVSFGRPFQMLYSQAYYFVAPHISKSTWSGSSCMDPNYMADETFTAYCERLFG